MGGADRQPFGTRAVPLSEARRNTRRRKEAWRTPVYARNAGIQSPKCADRPGEMPNAGRSGVAEAMAKVRPARLRTRHSGEQSRWIPCARRAWPSVNTPGSAEQSAILDTTPCSVMTSIPGSWASAASGADVYPILTVTSCTRRAGANSFPAAGAPPAGLATRAWVERWSSVNIRNDAHSTRAPLSTRSRIIPVRHKPG